MPAPYRRKLIEVDLPLAAINQSAGPEKNATQGYPSTLHIWWARRPLGTCRAVLFASMVDDPASCPDEFPTVELQRQERERLHNLIRRLIVWKNSTDENLVAEARYEIARSVARGRGEQPPSPNEPSEVLAYLGDTSLPIYDPFSGGGSIPLEAQRLGLRAVASDLNPVAVMITKALIELPPKFTGQAPVNPDADPMGITVGKGKRAKQVPWRGAAGLADDIRYYGRWMQEKAWERIGHLYPTAKLPDGNEATVVAWVWARTVPCPNPACAIDMPLMRTFQLSTKRNRQHWTVPLVDRDDKAVSFEVQNHNYGIPESGTVNRNGAICLACSSTSSLAYVREQALAGNMKEQMVAIVAEGTRGKLFLSPTTEHIRIAQSCEPAWRPPGTLPRQARSISVQAYGFLHWHQLFTERQLTALTTFSDLLAEVKTLVIQHGANAEYADAVCTYLALAIGRNTNGCSSFCRWENSSDFVAGVFSRQGIPMVWDFGESNPFSNSTKNWSDLVKGVATVVERLPTTANAGAAYQANASTTIHADDGPVIVTDPPYYDNIHYADSSDFFYVWLRQVLRDIYPELFAGIQVPKEEEMIASRFRFENPSQRFENLLNQTLRLIRERCSPEFPSSIFYAYKQQEEERDGRTSTGWETMLTALVSSGFQISGTWPMRTELVNRSNSQDANSLASSIVLVCRPRAGDAPPGSRREFLDALEAEMPAALDQLTREGHIAPVDLAQAAIGPGMQVYSRYSRVETISGEQVTVREALAAINQAIANYDERQEGELDPPTRFCLDWMKQHGFGEGQYGEAQTLAQAKNVAIEDELRDTHGLVTAQGGSVQLQPPTYFAANRMPSSGRMTAWEGCFRMAWNLDHEDGSIQGAADIARRMGSNAESVERLARILYNHFDRIRDSRRAVLFNNLVTSWDAIQAEMSKPPQGQLV